jgi:hypothetical protein
MYAVLGGRGRDDPASSKYRRSEAAEQSTDITMLRLALTLAILAMIAIILLQHWLQRARANKGKPHGRCCDLNDDIREQE